MGKPISKITIVGGGTSGWITACFLARSFGAQVKRGEMMITLIESKKIGIIGVGESTARPITDLLRFIGINEKEFVTRCDATFKLGGWFDGWDNDANGNPISWVNPFFTQSEIEGMNPGYMFARFGMHPGGDHIKEDYSEAMSVCPEVIRAHRGPRPLDGQEFQAFVPYSYHMNAVELAKILMEHGTGNLGVQHIYDDVTDVRMDERGFVKELELEEKGVHPIEFIIDGTGFASVIIGKKMGEPFIPYDNYLLNDRAAVAQIPHQDPTRIEPTSKAIAMRAGWSFRVPLFNRVGAGYVFSSKFLSDDEAIAEFLEHAGPIAKDAEPKVIRMRIGKTRRSRVKNCLALGLSSGFVEPLEATAIYSVQLALMWLVRYFPDTDFEPSVEKRYNELIDGLYSEIVDFIVMTFHLSNRTDTDYWRVVREDMEIPDSLQANLDLWRHTMPDKLDLPNSTFFTPNSYRSALMGKRFYKGRSYPQSAMVDDGFWEAFINARRQRSQEFLAKLPDHYTLLRRIRGEDQPVTGLGAQPLFVPLH